MKSRPSVKVHHYSEKSTYMYYIGNINLFVDLVLLIIFV